MSEFPYGGSIDDYRYEGGYSHPLLSINEWLLRVESCGVPQPDTWLFSIEQNDSTEPPSIDSSEVVDMMESRGWDKAFMRSMMKSADGNLAEGSVINNPSEEHIDWVFDNLVSSHFVHDRAMDGAIAVREWLDLQHCDDPYHYKCHPETRFFVDSGKVLYEWPDMDTADYTTECGVDLELTDGEKREVREYAEELADEFTENSRAIDFVYTTGGEWYCIDVNLNGWTWSKYHGWADIAQHRPDSKYSFEQYIELPPNSYYGEI